MNWNYLLPMIIGSILGPLLGYYIYKWRARVDLETMRERAQLSPVEVLSQAIVRRDQQMELLMTNHLAHDRQEREAIVKCLADIQAKDAAHLEAIRGIAEDLTAHRDEEGRARKEGHEDFGRIENRLTAIEVASGLRKPA